MRRRRSHRRRQELRQIVDFETGLYTAQSSDTVAGSLNTRGAGGGPVALSHQPFFIGINDPLGQNPTGAAFDDVAFTLFDSWSAASSLSGDRAGAAPAAIARGQALFNSRAFNITDVGGLNGRSTHGVHWRHVHHLPRLTEYRQSLREGAARPRPHERRAPHA